MRSKEEAHDYRYFPDPDLLPLELTQDYVDSLKKSLPELPDAKRQRFIGGYKLSPMTPTCSSPSARAPSSSRPSPKDAMGSWRSRATEKWPLTG